MEKKNILILDNEAENLSLLTSRLKTKYNIFTLQIGQNIEESMSDFPRPDTVFIYKASGDTRCFELLKVFSHSLDYRDIPVIVFSEKESPHDKIKGLNEGAVDYLISPFNPDEVAAKIASILKYKERCLESHNIRLEAEILGTLKNLDKDTTVEEFPEENLYTHYNITLREREIIELLCKGLLAKEISNSLHVSKRTVEFHVNNIYSKFKVKNRMELLRVIKRN